MSAKPHISDELKANIAEDLAIGCSVGEIIDRYGVSFGIIQLLKQKTFEKYKPSLLNWIDERSMEKSPEVVQAPTKTVSEDTIDSGSPADTNIITDVPEVVKQEEIPGVVVDALLEKIQNISTKIETEEKYLAALKADKKSLERWYHENCTAFGRDYKRRNDHAAR